SWSESGGCAAGAVALAAATARASAFCSLLSMAAPVSPPATAPRPPPMSAPGTVLPRPASSPPAVAPTAPPARTPLSLLDIELQPDGRKRVSNTVKTTTHRFLAGDRCFLAMLVPLLAARGRGAAREGAPLYPWGAGASSAAENHSTLP